MDISERNFANPVYQAYLLLHAALVLAPLVAGIDKFLYILVDWDVFLNPYVAAVIPTSLFMKVVGVLEIGVALLIGWRPAAGAFVLALWMLGVIINLLVFPAYYDIVLRDFGIFLSTLSLSRLARFFEPGFARERS